METEDGYVITRTSIRKEFFKKLSLEEQILAHLRQQYLNMLLEFIHRSSTARFAPQSRFGLQIIMKTLLGQRNHQGMDELLKFQTCLQRIKELRSDRTRQFPVNSNGLISLF